MNKVSMDALNRGWAVGHGTNVRRYNADFAFAVVRLGATAPAAAVRKPGALAVFPGRIAAAAGDFVISISRRLAR
jgi:hypothetical protein